MEFKNAKIKIQNYTPPNKGASPQPTIPEATSSLA